MRSSFDFSRLPLLCQEMVHDQLEWHEKISCRSASHIFTAIQTGSWWTPKRSETCQLSLEPTGWQIFKSSTDYMISICWREDDTAMQTTLYINSYAEYSARNRYQFTAFIRDWRSFTLRLLNSNCFPRNLRIVGIYRGSYDYQKRLKLPRYVEHLDIGSIDPKEPGVAFIYRFLHERRCEGSKVTIAIAGSTMSCSQCHKLLRQVLFRHSQVRISVANFEGYWQPSQVEGIIYSLLHQLVTENAVQYDARQVLSICFWGRDEATWRRIYSTRPIEDAIARFSDKSQLGDAIIVCGYDWVTLNIVAAKNYGWKHRKEVFDDVASKHMYDSIYGNANSYLKWEDFSPQRQPRNETTTGPLRKKSTLLNFLRRFRKIFKLERR